MIIYTIYKSVNTKTGKVYIGFDSNWPNRKRQHITESHRNSSTKFYRAIRKYGIDNFNWEIVYQSKDGNYCKNIMESYFIQEYDTFKNGYNMTLGGDGTLGHKHNINSISKIKQASLEKWKNPNFILNSIEHKQIVSIKQKEIQNCPEINNKRIDTLSKEWSITNPSGEKFTIKNLQKFCKENDLTSSNMKKVARGERAHHKGWSCSIPHIHPIGSH
jgi:group I intron endonuclease